MPKAVSANEAKPHFGELLDYVGEHADGVIVERRGPPPAVLMPIASYEAIQTWREHQRRDEALACMKDLREQVTYHWMKPKPKPSPSASAKKRLSGW